MLFMKMGTISNYDITPEEREGTSRGKLIAVSSLIGSNQKDFGGTERVLNIFGRLLILPT